MNNSTCSRRSLVKGMAGAAAFAIVGGLGLAGCGDPAAKADGSAPSDAAFKIGVLQLTEHPALDAANKGFVAAVEEAGIGAKINQQNAQNDQSACQTIASTLANEGCDLILAIATPAAQAVAGVPPPTSPSSAPPSPTSPPPAWSRTMMPPAATSPAPPT